MYISFQERTINKSLPMEPSVQITAIIVIGLLCFAYLYFSYKKDANITEQKRIDEATKQKAIEVLGKIHIDRLLQC